MKLKNKTILITGATSGFGRGTARRCVKEGARVILTGRREERLKELVEELGAAHCQTLTFDVQDREAVDAALASLPEEWQAIDVLVNNAGLALGLSTTQDGNVEHWEVMIDTNIKGLLYVTRSVLPGMLTRNKGHIINIGSMAGNWPYPNGNVYGSTKAFVKHFSLELRIDLLGTPIRVTNLEPGSAETEFSLVRLQDKEKADVFYEGYQPLTEEDIAECVVWSASLPEHVNINRMEVMPIAQAPGIPMQIARKKLS